MKETSWVITNAQAVTERGLIADATIIIQGGRIARIGRQRVARPRGARPLDAAGRLVLPGFIDLHVHGGSGADVMDGSVEAVHSLARHLAAHGVTGFLPTTVTASLEDTLTAAAAVRRARSLPNAGAAILGMHLEGPYINHLRPGAQAKQHIRPPSVNELEQVIAASGECVRLVTLAPEVPGGLQLVAYAHRRGIVVSMGHSDATYEQAMAAIEAGVSHVTHVFNAMRPLHHREPGIPGAALVDRRVMAELIADGLHVHPAAARLLITARGPEGVVLVTDAVRGAGLPYGCYLMTGRQLCTSEQGARLADGTLAGSLLTLEVALQNAVAWSGLPLHAAIAMAGLNQARELGLDDRTGSLAPGKDADLVICTPDYKVLTTMVGGRIVYGEGA